MRAVDDAQAVELERFGEVVAAFFKYRGSLRKSSRAMSQPAFFELRQAALQLGIVPELDVPAPARDSSGRFARRR
jgi:hypothetical protein